MSRQVAATTPPLPCGTDPAVARATRRAVLAAAFLLPAAASAQTVDDSLAGVVRRGVLRVNIGYWTASFVPQPAPGEPRMRDSFHEALARQIARQFGVRAELLPARESGDGIQRLNSGAVDLALAPPLTRSLLRQIMFCAPHAMMDLVVLGRTPPEGERARPRLDAMRLGTLSVLAPTLADRGALTSMMPVATPWLLMEHLLEGRLDGVIVTRVMADSALVHFEGAGLRVQQAITSAAFGGAVAYGAHDLRRAVNLAIEQLLLDGSLAALFRREMGLPFNPPYPE